MAKAKTLEEFEDWLIKNNITPALALVYRDLHAAHRSHQTMLNDLANERLRVGRITSAALAVLRELESQTATYTCTFCGCDTTDGQVHDVYCPVDIIQREGKRQKEQE